MRQCPLKYKECPLKRPLCGRVVRSFEIQVVKNGSAEGNIVSQKVLLFDRAWNGEEQMNFQK